MSTSLLYHAFGVRGYTYTRTTYVGGGVEFHITKPLDQCRCAACGSPEVAPRGKVERRFRTVPIGRRPVTVVYPIPRVECAACGAIRQVDLDFAEPRRSFTKSFARYALELCRLMTIQDVAHHLGVSWDVIKDIHKQDLHRRFAKPKFKHLKRIAIDEICIGAGHRYLTLVLDLDSGAVVHVGQGKGGDALTNFWKRLRRSGAKVEAVATDMSPAYIAAVSAQLSEATLVFDRFHVLKLFNEKLTALRRELYRQATAEGKKVLKGVRWLLLKNPEHLDGLRHERPRLEAALKLNEPLATAYYLKEELREFWEQADEDEAAAFLLDWIERAEASGIRMLGQFAQTLRAHALGLLAYYDYPISTGPLEGTNNKIKTMQRQAFGFRDQEYFTLRILAAHEAKYALVG
jgi:transposase